MAIAYDNASHSGFLNSTSNNLAHTTSGTNRGLCVYVYAGTDVVTGVTYNGVGATFVNKLLMTGAAAGQYIYFYYLHNPASGSNTVTVTSSGNLGGYISAVSYTGVKQTGNPTQNNTQASASTASLTTSVTTTENNSWLVGYSYMNGPQSAGADTTLRGGSVAGVLETMDSDGPKSPTGSYGLTTTQSAAFAGHVMGAIAPVVSGPAGVKTWNGVAVADIKTYNGIPWEDVKTLNGIA